MLKYITIIKTAQGDVRGVFSVPWLTAEQNKEATELFYYLKDADFLSSTDKGRYYAMMEKKILNLKPKTPVTPAPAPVTPAPVTPAPVTPAPTVDHQQVPEWVNVARGNRSGAWKKFTISKQLLDNGYFAPIFDIANLPSVSVDGTQIDTTGSAATRQESLNSENDKRQKLRNHYVASKHYRYNQKTGETKEQYSMRLARPETVRGFPFPGLSVDEINAATGQMWTDEKLQRGVTSDINQELNRRFREENKAELADLRDDYLVQKGDIRVQPPSAERRNELSKLDMRYKQSIRHMKEMWMKTRA